MKPEDKLFPPPLDGRLSTGTQQTFATSTTRASSVVPAARANMGLSEEEADNMSAGEAFDHYNDTETGNVNKNRFDNVMLPQPVARSLNEETEEAQTKAMRARNAEQTAKEEEAKRKGRKLKLKFLLSFVAVFVVVAIIATSIVVTNRGNDGNDDDQQSNTNEPDADLQILDLSNEEFDFDLFNAACLSSPDTFRGFGACLQRKDNNQFILVECGDDGVSVDPTQRSCDLCDSNGCERNAVFQVGTLDCNSRSCDIEDELDSSNRDKLDFEFITSFINECEDASDEADISVESICVKDEFILNCDLNGQQFEVNREDCHTGCSCNETEVLSNLCFVDPKCNDEQFLVSLVKTNFSKSEFKILCETFTDTFVGFSICDNDSLVTCNSSGILDEEFCAKCDQTVNGFCDENFLTKFDLAECEVADVECVLEEVLEFDDLQESNSVAGIIDLIDRDCDNAQESIFGFCESETNFIGCNAGEIQRLGNCVCTCANDVASFPFCPLVSNGRDICNIARPTRGN